MRFQSASQREQARLTSKRERELLRATESLLRPLAAQLSDKGDETLRLLDVSCYRLQQEATEVATKGCKLLLLLLQPAATQVDGG